MELEWIKRLRESPGTQFLGDDAAVLGDTLLTVDMLTEGVDFLLEETDPVLIGRKALAVNLSDIAAMGGVPRAAVVAVALPSRKKGAVNDDPAFGLDLADRLYKGMKPLLEKYTVALAGGDTNRWDGGLVIAITVSGKVTARGPIRRSGGRPDDVLLVTGPLGGSLLGRQFFFEPRINEALYLNEHFEIHAAIDLSDGLALDLSRLASESRLGAVVESESIPVSSSAVVLSKRSGRSPLEHALSDGEDFELLFAVAESESRRLLETQPLRQRFGTTLYRVGRLTRDPGLHAVGVDGRLRPLEPKGFVH